MKDIILISSGAILGALSRFFINESIKKNWTTTFPMGTLVINILGCLIIGFIYESYKDHPQFLSLYYFLMVGFLGSLTTFSAFSLETLQLIRSQHLGLGLLNVFASVGLCLGAVFLGSLLSDFFKA